MNAPSAVKLGENDYTFSGTGRKNYVRRSFTLFPDQNLIDQEVCFSGKDNKDTPKSTGERCVTLTVRYPPRFVTPTPLPSS